VELGEGLFGMRIEGVECGIKDPIQCGSTPSWESNEGCSRLAPERLLELGNVLEARNFDFVFDFLIFREQL